MLYLIKSLSQFQFTSFIVDQDGILEPWVGLREYWLVRLNVAFNAEMLHSRSPKFVITPFEHDCRSFLQAYKASFC